MMNDIYGIDISPFQGSEIRVTSYHRAVPCAAILCPFRAWNWCSL
jgi:hypothetical protein